MGDLFQSNVGMPLISVIMSVYNGEKFLRQAIDSILAQTYKDFEFIIIDDGSTDQSQAIIESYARSDSRVRLFSHAFNQGLTVSLQEGVQAARGEYVARMDADDISYPERLAKQLSLFQSNPALKAVGCNVEIINAEGKNIKQVAISASQLASLSQRNSLVHGSMLYNRAGLQAVGGYNIHYRYAQDYDLLLRLAERYKIGRVEEYLYQLRRTSATISNKKFFRQLYYTARAKYDHALRQHGTNRSPLYKGWIFLKEFFYTSVVIYKLGLPKLKELFR